MLQALGRLLGRREKEPSLAVRPEAKETLTTALTLPPWLDERPLFTPWSTDRAIRYGYKASGVLYSCIELMADAAASVPLTVYERGDRGQLWAKSPDHPLQALLDRPNEYMPQATMSKFIVQHLLLGGNAIWTKTRFLDGPMKGLPAELWPISPDHIRPVPSRRDYISHYEWNNFGEKVEIEPEDVLHFMQLDPSNPYWGVGALQALFRAIETDTAAGEFQKVGMSNRGIVGGVLAFKMPLSRDQYEAAREQVDVGLGGSANARKILVLGSDAAYTAMSMTPEEMDFVESRRMTREEIVQGMRVPPPMVGIYDDATLANIETSRKIFWLDRMIPFLAGIASVHNRMLVPEFGDPDRLWVGFDTTEVDALQQNLQEKVEAFKGLVEARVKPLAAARVVGLDLTDADIEEASALLGGFMAGPGAAEKKSTLEADPPAAWPEERKYGYWKRTDDLRRTWEDRVAREIERLFAEEAERVVERGVDGIEPARWRETLTAVYMAGIEVFFEESYARVAKAAGVPGETKQFARIAEAIQDWVRMVVAGKVVRITDTTRRTIMQRIEETVRGGGGVDDVARAVRRDYDHWRGADDSDIDVRRSYTIARTEMGAITGFGNRQGVVEAARDFGATVQKTWISARDSRVRESHADLEGQTRPLEEPYSNGLMYPGDPNGPASEVIQCRCVEAYDVAEGQVQQVAPEPEQPALRGEFGGSRSVRDFLTVNRSQPQEIREGVEEGLRLIEQVHGVGTLGEKAIPVRAFDARRAAQPKAPHGTYFPRGRSAERIELNVGSFNGDQGGLLETFVHEVGHFIDHQGLRGRDPYTRAVGWATRSQGKHLDGWREAVRSSQAYKTLAGARRVNGQVRWRGRSFRWPDSYLEYSLRDDELFARAYAQFIAEETGDARILGSIQARAKMSPIQWDEADFAPIRAEMRKLFGLE